MCDISDSVPRLGIRNFNWWSEALHGLANNDSVTVFPQPIAMAASFDDALVYRIFSAVSDEVRAKYNQSKARGPANRRFLSLSVWTPNVSHVPFAATEPDFSQTCLQALLRQAARVV